MQITWWEGLTNAEQAFWGIAIIFSVLFSIQFILSLIGLDFDGDADFDFNTEVDTSAGDQFGMEAEFTVFSVRSIIAFFTFFGWTGAMLLGTGVSVWIALLAAGIVGFIAMLMVAYVMYRISNMDESGTIKSQSAINHYGQVYLNIPPTKSGYGKIHLKLKGSTREMDAVTDELELIPTGAKVKVIDVLDDNLLLVKVMP